MKTGFSTEHTLHSDKHFSTISEITSVHTNSPAVTSPFTCTGHARAGVNRKQVLYCYSWLLSYRKYYEQLLLLTYFYFYFLLYVTGTRTGTEKLSLSLRSYSVHAIFVITSTVCCCYCRGSYHKRTWTFTEVYQGQFGHLKVFFRCSSQPQIHS